MPLDSGFGPLNPAPPANVSVKKVEKDFLAKEAEFYAAMKNYTWVRTARVVARNGSTGKKGEYYEVDAVGKGPRGRRVEEVLKAPPSTMMNAGVYMSYSDFQDIDHRMPFVLTGSYMSDYRVKYVGQQKVDQVKTYVFEVSPRKIRKGRRYFDGRIWVDQRDHQIVVTDGKSVPDDLKRGHEDLSLPFITFYQQVDGKYWFPAWTHGAGWLHFEGGRGYMSENVHMRETITYTKYKRFGSSSTLIFRGHKIGNAKPGGQKTPGQPQKQGQKQGQNQGQAGTQPQKPQH